MRHLEAKTKPRYTSPETTGDITNTFNPRHLSQFCFYSGVILMEETNSTNQDQPVDKFELKLQRSADGQKANSRGKLVAALVGRASGAVRAEGYDNNIWAIDDARVRFTSVTGGKQTFSFNPAGPASLIVASSEDVPTPDKPLLNRLYGLRLVDCVRAGRRATTAAAPKRISVSLGHITGRVRLGTAYLPAKYTEAASVGDRMDLMDAIDVLTSDELGTMMDTATREKIREFVLEGREELAPAAEPAPLAPVEEVAQAVEQEPAESTIEGDVDDSANRSAA